MADGLETLSMRVTLAGGAVERVTIRNPDLVRWDIERAAAKWPPQEDAKFLWLTFVTWAAMQRDGTYSEPFKKFRLEDCLGIDDAETDAVDPTQTVEEGA